MRHMRKCQGYVRRAAKGYSIGGFSFLGDKNMLHRISIRLLPFIFFFNLLSTSSYAGDAILSWNSPTTNMDGSPLNDLAGYRIYYGTASGSYSQQLNLGNVTT